MSKILLVEDNEMNRDILCRRLERKGFEAIIAVDGQAGVEMAASSAPDIILMDLSLPVIDGWEATRRIKADPATQATPVIALTAHAMAGDEQKALEAGCDDYDIKTIDFKRLLGCVNLQLQNRYFNVVYWPIVIAQEPILMGLTVSKKRLIFAVVGHL